ncbi:hypothetical protein [Streptomyces sp. URMC 125]|uniref:hypothetical protein n=1 Tax=Streptomyces sp. URMC 125 TaxID=3423419 RepID=UPI003F195C7F
MKEIRNYVGRVVYDAGRPNPAVLEFGFESTASLDEFSENFYGEIAENGLYDDSVPGKTEFIPLHRIYSASVEVIE